MNSSDIIAIVAIVISAIVSVLSAYISLKNNKANIEARRLEMAFEKRLEAFREILEGMGNFRRFVSENRNSLQSDNPEEYFAKLREQYYKFFSTYQKLRFYIPPNARQIFTDYARFVLDYINRKDSEHTKDFGAQLRDKENEITDLLQKFLGL